MFLYTFIYILYVYVYVSVFVSVSLNAYAYIYGDFSKWRPRQRAEGTNLVLELFPGQTFPFDSNSARIPSDKDRNGIL